MGKRRRLAAALSALASLLAISVSPARSASDTALRAMYCLPILDRDIELVRKVLPEVGRGVASALRQQLTSEGAKLENLLTTSRERLRLYALNAALDEPLAMLAANKRGEIDAAQCQAEIDPQKAACAHPCAQKCALGEIPCNQRCYVTCGMPTCARTAVCINPTWLPY